MPEHMQVKRAEKGGERISEAQMWLCALTSSNFEILKKNKVYGIPNNRRALNLLKKVRVGDTLLFYVISPVKRILGISSAISTVFQDNRKAPWRDRSYPYRIRISKVQDISVRVADIVGKIEGLKSRVPRGASLILLDRNDLEKIKSLSWSSSR